jgi:hypothetical protein
MRVVSQIQGMRLGVPPVGLADMPVDSARSVRRVMTRAKVLSIM